MIYIALNEVTKDIAVVMMWQTIPIPLAPNSIEGQIQYTGDVGTSLDTNYYNF